MTITLKTDDKIREALKQAFPDHNTDRALNKYVALVEQLIFKALQHGQTPEQHKLNLYSLSTHVLTQRGGCIGSKKVRIHKWLADNGLALIEPVRQGSNLSGKISECKLTSWATLHNSMTTPTGETFEAMTDREIDIVLAGSEDEHGKLIELVYPNIEALGTPEEIQA